MTEQAGSPKHPPVLGLHHSAYRCRDSEETRQFYEDVLGFPLVVALEIDRHPTTGEPVKYLHTFFDIGSHHPEESNYIAFFEVVDRPEDDPRELFKRRWGMDLHFAMRVPDHETLHAWKEKIESRGVEVEGPIDHGFITSIYFHDPNGYRLEFSAESAQEKVEFERHRAAARSNFQAWQDWKARHRQESPKTAVLEA